MKRPLVWVALAYFATLGVVSLFWGDYIKIFFYILSGVAIVGAFYRRKPMIYMLLGAVLGMAVIVPHYLKHLEIESKLGQEAKLTLSIEETRFYGDHFGYYLGEGILNFADGKQYKGTMTLEANEPYAAAEGQTILVDTRVIKVKKFWQSAGGDKLSVKQGGDIIASDTSLRPLREYFIKLNRKLTLQTYGFIPQKSAAIINAVVLGEGRGIDDKTRDALNTAALSHIVVVSGQHLVIAASIVTILLRDKRKPLAVLISLACGWVFAALTGFSPSMLRGAVMFTTAQIGLLFGKKSDSISSLCLAALIMTAFDPSILLSFSFILSASAVLGIGIVGSYITKEGISAYKKLFGEISSSSAGRIGIVGTILGAQFGVLPGLVYLNGSIPIYGLITNLLVLPILLPLMLCGAVSILLSFISPNIASILGILSTGLVQMILPISDFFTSLPSALIPFGNHYQLLWLFLTVLFALLSLFYDFDKFTRRAIVTSLLLSIMLGSWVYLDYSKNTYDLYTFDEFNTVVYAKDKAGVIIGLPDKDNLPQLAALLKRLGMTELEHAVITTKLSGDQAITQLIDHLTVHNIICDPDPLLQNTAEILKINIIDKGTVNHVSLQDLAIKVDYTAIDFNTPAAYIERELIASEDCKVIKLYMPLAGINRYKIKIGDDHDLS